MRSFRARPTADPPPSPSRLYCGGNQSRPRDDEWTSLMLFICLLFTQQSGKMRGQQQMGNVLILALRFLRGTHLMYTASGEAKGTRAWPPLNHGALSVNSTWRELKISGSFSVFIQPSEETRPSICRLDVEEPIRTLFCYLDTHPSPPNRVHYCRGLLVLLPCIYSANTPSDPIRPHQLVKFDNVQSVTEQMVR